MSVETARAMLLTAAKLAEGAFRDVLAQILAELDAPAGRVPEAPRTGPKSNAERCRAWRKNRRQARGPDTPNVSPDTATDTKRNESDTIVASAPSHTLPSLRSSVSPLFSSPDLSPSESQDPGESEGNTGAREASGNGAPAPTSSTPPNTPKFTLAAPNGARPTRDATRNDTATDTTDTKRKRKPREDVGHRLPKDWTPSAEDLRWTRAQGVDAEAVLEEFRDHWVARADARARKADWDATYRNRVRTLLQEGKAPPLRQDPPPRAPAEPPASPAEAARIIAEAMQGVTRKIPEPGLEPHGR